MNHGVCHARVLRQSPEFGTDLLQFAKRHLRAIDQCESPCVIAKWTERLIDRLAPQVRSIHSEPDVAKSESHAFLQLVERNVEARPRWIIKPTNISHRESPLRCPANDRASPANGPRVPLE